MNQNRWESVGRELLKEKLELALNELDNTFIEARRELNDGELSAEQIEKMRAALDEVYLAVETAAEASPEAERKPRLFEQLDEDGREQYRQLLNDVSDDGL